MRATLDYSCSTIGEVSYSNDIAPLISNSCATNQGPGTGCHDAWIFEYANVKNIVVNGKFQAVCIDSKKMPIIPNNFGIAPLTEEEIQLISCWIYNAAPNN